MIRRGFTMKLLPGFVQEYKSRHDAIWPELAQLLKDSGISNYSIFLDEHTLVLFGYMQLTETNHTKDLAGKDIMMRWWAYMKDIMEVNPDNSPVSKECTEVFYLA